MPEAASPKVHLRAHESREFAVIRVCARREAQADFDQRVVQLLRAGIDWALLIRLAKAHQILPLVYRSLRRLPADIVPPEVIAEFQKYGDATLRNNLSMLTKLFQVLELLAEAGIPCIPYKGPSLAALAYSGNFGLRPFGDLDIFVPPSAYEKTRDVFRAHGYSEAADLGWESSMVDPIDRIPVDIHRAITSARFPVRLDFARLHHRLVGVPIGGREIRTVSPEDMLIILSIQLAKDSLGITPPLRLSKVCDIAELLRSHPDLNWRQIVCESQRLGCEHILLFGLLFSRELVGAPEATAQLRKMPHAIYEELALHVENKLVNQMAPDYRGYLSNNQFQAKIRERRRDKLYPYLRDFTMMFRPSHLDRDFVHLPEPLKPLYYLVRPVRVLGDLWKRRHGSDAKPRPDSSKQ